MATTASVSTVLVAPCIAGGNGKELAEKQT